MSECNHDVVAQDMAVNADGMCPLCLVAELRELRKGTEMTPDQITQLRQLITEIKQHGCCGYAVDRLNRILALLPCPKCEEILQEKCNWEQMTRKAVLEEWPNLKCPDCK